MQTKSLAVLAAVGITAAIAVPTVAFGNARSDQGTFHYIQVAQTPLIAQLSGANEVPPGDPDGVGAASVTVDVVDSVNAQVCWDLTYRNIVTPSGATGIRQANGPILVPFTGLGASSATGCATVAVTLAQTILDSPANFSVDVTNGAPGGGIRGQLSQGPKPAGEAHLLPVPLRAYDSRDNGGLKIAALETRTISLATGKDGQGATEIAVPPGATGAIVTLTVTSTVGPGGFLKLYSAAITEPATSSINWAGANQNLAVTTQVAVDSADQVKVTGGANSTHFVIDVIGYLF
ncbi:MAG: CHRD domain-containing protein [Ilumatobacteraceae bacterium]